MQVKTVTRKRVVVKKVLEQTTIRSYALTETEALFIRDVLGGLCSSTICDVIKWSSNFSGLAPNKDSAEKFHRNLFEALNEALKSAGFTQNGKVIL